MDLIEAAKKYEEEQERNRFGFEENGYKYFYDKVLGCWVVYRLNLNLNNGG